MKQYLNLLQDILDKGTRKEAAREGMPGTLSLFGYQFRHNLQDGFPLITTKKMYWKGVVIELLWFLKGDTNIKYLLDNNVNIWNQDAYNYYVKIASANTGSDANKIYFNNNDGTLRMWSFEEFIEVIKTIDNHLPKWNNYTLGDCGYQYGKVWRSWNTNNQIVIGHNGTHNEWGTVVIDQIANVIKSLKENPEGRRHIVSAWDPAHDSDLALTWCHALFQFNCRKIEYFEGDGVTFGEEGKFYYWVIKPKNNTSDYLFKEIEASSKEEIVSNDKYPTFFLDCQLYQRSADVILGVPFNIASYALLTHIIAKLCNMIPGEFIHTFGDVHIYDNHLDAVYEQLRREPRELPKLNLESSIFNSKDHPKATDIDLLENMIWEDFQSELENYNPYPKLESETKLSTGLK